MRIIAILCFVLLQSIAQGQVNTLYDETLLPSIFVTIEPDSLTYMLEEQLHDRYMHADFVFDAGIGTTPDTVLNIGLRLRGNTSLTAAKKSFKISFDAFEIDRKYQGVKKINLRAQQNDPTLIREKLFYEVWHKAGRPERRMSFARFYINGTYRGLYTNAEELDKTWLKRVFGDNSGNFYKCLWPADLQYLGNNQQTYKDIMHNAEDRAYRLTTNELEDDYTRFVSLVAAINQPNNAAYTTQLQAILNVEGVLSAYAIDIATGNWDNYFYLKNNYYLYDNPTTGRFEFITYDTDNSLGVDWVNRDWATRNALNWQSQSEPRPLATKLLAVPELRYRFVTILDSITRHITCPDTIFPRIDALYNHILEAAAEDEYRAMDYGYTVEDILKGINETVDDHTPYGVKPFLGLRKSKTLEQIGSLVSLPSLEAATTFSFAPNPVSDKLILQRAQTTLRSDYPTVEVEVYNMQGLKMFSGEWQATVPTFDIEVRIWAMGVYWVKIGSFTQKILVMH